ncbi:hypothetical protein CONPUDRAFT_154840 [Coniophora puteana RWD-64-598 SS2]|uniref:Uncharacterized protein n=1 Tax=Coniophora puteana (strain RWD-64-598) TaxID=741705 RepID=A0A5M3MQR0_CONPW|nr:uncharacterized protein CONPUDRAFT_154840 [Coniophora puteana RWD-64-598 SS2]EIW80851.1 hypothetical protein CONPUDRAFT_154840 [Coniophora puteana RWD-64-598 SS2]
MPQVTRSTRATAPLKAPTAAPNQPRRTSTRKTPVAASAAGKKAAGKKLGAARRGRPRKQVCDDEDVPSAEEVDEADDVAMDVDEEEKDDDHDDPDTSRLSPLPPSSPPPPTSDDEDEPPVKSKRGRKAQPPSYVEEADDEEPEEEATSVKRKRGRKAPTQGYVDEDDEEEEEPHAKRGKGKGKATHQAELGDDVDEDRDEDEDAEVPEPTAKSKGSRKRGPLSRNEIQQIAEAGADINKILHPLMDETGKDVVTLLKAMKIVVPGTRQTTLHNMFQAYGPKIGKYADAPDRNAKISAWYNKTIKNAKEDSQATAQVRTAAQELIAAARESWENSLTHIISGQGKLPKSLGHVLRYFADEAVRTLAMDNIEVTGICINKRLNVKGAGSAIFASDPTLFAVLEKKGIDIQSITKYMGAVSITHSIEAGCQVELPNIFKAADPTIAAVPAPAAHTARAARIARAAGAHAAAPAPAAATLAPAAGPSYEANSPGPRDQLRSVAANMLCTKFQEAGFDGTRMVYKNYCSKAVAFFIVLRNWSMCMADRPLGCDAFVLNNVQHEALWALTHDWVETQEPDRIRTLSPSFPYKTPREADRIGKSPDPTDYEQDLKADPLTFTRWNSAAIAKWKKGDDGYFPLVIANDGTYLMYVYRCNGVKNFMQNIPSGGPSTVVAVVEDGMLNNADDDYVPTSDPAEQALEMVHQSSTARHAHGPVAAPGGLKPRTMQPQQSVRSQPSTQQQVPHHLARALEQPRVQSRGDVHSSQAPQARNMPVVAPPPIRMDTRPPALGPARPSSAAREAGPSIQPYHSGQAPGRYASGSVQVASSGHYVRGATETRLMADEYSDEEQGYPNG